MTAHGDIMPTPVRLALYELLLAQPGRHWTVRILADALHKDMPASKGAVRDTVNLLLAQRLLATVSYERAMTVRVTPLGEQNLTVWLRHARHSGTTDATTTTGRK